jgi:hypothetical protein
MAYIDTVELLPCKKCGSVGALKSIVNGNVAILCTNKDCKNATRGKSGFKGSDRMAVDDWNRRNAPRTPKERERKG